MEVYQRINDELKNRKLKQQEGKEDIEGLLKVEIAPKRKASTADLASTSLEETYADKPLLSRKTSMAFEVEIPSFFNDKKQKCEPLPAPVKNDLKKEEDKPCSCLKNCIKSKNIFLFCFYLILYLGFGKGLFDEKLDFEPSSDMETFRVVKKQNFDDELKEIEIKSAMFNAVPEDMFFSLD